MKARERTTVTRVPATRPSGPVVVAPRVAGEDSAPLSVWHDWFQRASPSQQAEALSLAERQGFVSLPQLPAPAAASRAKVGEAAPNLFHQLFAGDLHGLALFTSPMASVEASVAIADRVLAAPDLFLWARRNESKSSSAVAQIIRRAVEQGRRVLYVGSHLAPLERTLYELAGDPEINAIRYTAPGEKASNGPLTRFDLDAQRRLFLGRLAASAEMAKHRLTEDQARTQRETETWTLLDLLAAEQSALDHRIQSLRGRMDGVLDEIEREACAFPGSDRSLGPFAAELFCRRAKFHHDHAQAEKARLFGQDRREALGNALASLREERALLGPRLAARKQGLWWSIRFWSTFINPTDLLHDQALEEQAARLEADLAAVTADLEKTEAALNAADVARQLDEKQLFDSEAERRRRELGTQLESLQALRADLQSRWHSATSTFADGNDRPEAPTVEAVGKARQAWRARREAQEAMREFARQWESFLASSPTNLVDRLPHLTPVLVGTMQALSRNADFAAAVDATFDLLVIDDAGKLTDSDLFNLARRARHWLLLGGLPPASTLPASCPSRPDPFQKLWLAIAPAKDRPTYCWSRIKAEGGDRLCCSLRPIAVHEARFVESERLADLMEIELRILVVPGSRPRLAQVLFPATMPIDQAKSLIYRELQEAAVDRLDRPNSWEVTHDAFVLHFEGPHAAEHTVELEPGLRESVCGKGTEFTTCRLAFDKAAGWNDKKVQEWCHRFLGFVDLGRTLVD